MATGACLEHRLGEAGSSLDVNATISTSGNLSWMGRRAGQAVHDRHREVHDHDVGAHAHRLECFSAVGGLRDDLAATVLERLFKQPAERLVIMTDRSRVDGRGSRGARAAG